MEATPNASGTSNLMNVPLAPEDIHLNPPQNLCSCVKELETIVTLLGSEACNLKAIVENLSARLADTNVVLVRRLAKDSCVENDAGKEVGRYVDRDPHVKPRERESYNVVQDAKVFKKFIWTMITRTKLHV